MFSTCLTLKKRNCVNNGHRYLYTGFKTKLKRGKRTHISVTWPHREEHYYANDKLHRVDGPAIICWHIYTEHIIKERWVKNGMADTITTDKPNEIHYFENGFKKVECWYVGDWLHRVNGPSKIQYYNNGKILRQEWQVYGRYHKSDEPCIITYHKNGDKSGEKWYYCGNLHRFDGPAKTRYYKNGRTHNEYYEYGRYRSRVLV